MAQFEVLRAHWGDRDGKRHRFVPGDHRELDPDDSLTIARVKNKTLTPAHAVKAKPAASDDK